MILSSTTSGRYRPQNMCLNYSFCESDVTQSRIGPCTTMLSKIARLCNDANVYKNHFN